MAEEAGEVAVKITADLKNLKEGLEKGVAQVQGFSAKTVAVGEIIAHAWEKVGEKVMEFAKECVARFSETELATARLSNVVGSTAAQAFVRMANELQKTTMFSDDAIISLQAQLANYGLMPGSIKEATEALIKYATATGKTLPEAGQMLAGAMAGQARELHRYGLELSQSDSASDRLAKTIKFMNDRWQDTGGIMGTLAGKTSLLHNAFDDFQKQIGTLVAPALKKFADEATSFLAQINKAIELNTTTGKSYTQQRIDQMEKEKMALMNLAQMQKGYLDEESRQRLVSVTNAIKFLKQRQEAEQKTVNAETGIVHIGVNKETAEFQEAAERTKEIRKATEDYVRKQIGETSTIAANALTKRVDELRQAVATEEAMERRITTITQLEAQQRTLAAANSFDSTATFSEALSVKLAEDTKSWGTIFAGMVMDVTKSFGKGVADMILDGKSFSEVMKNIWKDMARAFIEQVAMMIAKWLAFQALKSAFGGGFGGFMAEGGVIREPTLLTGLISGTQHIAGEAGPEAVVPMSRSNQTMAQAMGGGGGGGGSTINLTVQVSGQFIEGTPAKFQEMVRSTIVPELRRWAASHPNELLNRRRGAA